MNDNEKALLGVAAFLAYVWYQNAKSATQVVDGVPLPAPGQWGSGSPVPLPYPIDPATGLPLPPGDTPTPLPIVGGEPVNPYGNPPLHAAPNPIVRGPAVVSPGAGLPSPALTINSGGGTVSAAQLNQAWAGLRKPDAVRALFN